jgi:hypothetical protein
VSSERAAQYREQRAKFFEDAKKRLEERKQKEE